MNTPNWERLRIFKAVLESNSLSGAARQLGVSQPTISRQIRTLEKELGEVLINTTPDGVEITKQGLRLAPLVEDMMRSALQIVSDAVDTVSTPVVRIACGPWVASLIARHVIEMTESPATCQLEIVSSILFADIPRREADIAIRTKKPEKGRMKVRRLPHFNYAVYAAESLVAGRESAFDDRRFSRFEWAMLLPELDHFPTSKWLKAHCNKAPLLRCSTSINLLDAVKSGHVLAILPAFIGDNEHILKRVSSPFIPDHGQIWMVLPDDVGRRPHVRAVADRLVALFADITNST